MHNVKLPFSPHSTLLMTDKQVKCYKCAEMHTSHDDLGLKPDTDERWCEDDGDKKYSCAREGQQGAIGKVFSCRLLW